MHLTCLVEQEKASWRGESKPVELCAFVFLKEHQMLIMSLDPGAWQEWLRVMAEVEEGDPLFLKLPGLNCSQYSLLKIRLKSHK